MARYFQLCSIVHHQRERVMSVMTSWSFVQHLYKCTVTVKFPTTNNLHEPTDGHFSGTNSMPRNSGSP